MVALSIDIESNYLEEILIFTCEKNGTDLHICIGSKPLMRLNGKLLELEHMDVTNGRIIEEIIESLLDNSQRDQLIIDKSIDFSFSIPGLGRFRINVYSQRGTYAMAIRLLPFKIPIFEDLGLPESVKSFTTKAQGLFLTTGSTGSGKSTTLASLIDVINKNNNYHIITIEDPIEYLHKHEKSLMTQREIGQDANSFTSALRAALREDPDVIMLGEMRDPETISIALTAAETGHLVFSTLHTVGAAKSIDRILDAFEPSQQSQIRSQLATVLEGVVSQQLVPRIDADGMIIASEVMHVNTAIRNLIREGKHYQINSIIQTGHAQGMQSMEANLAKLCNQGIIDKEQTMLRVSDQQLFSQFLNRR
jgi:twitching motility protein PilT